MSQRISITLILAHGVFSKPDIDRLCDHLKQLRNLESLVFLLCYARIIGSKVQPGVNSLPVLNMRIPRKLIGRSSIYN